jgi:hypothetical protein
MSAPKVLMTIHYIGGVFVWLWFIGSCTKEGMWNNAVTLIDAWMAVFVTFPLWLAGSVLAIDMLNLKPGADDFHLIFAIVIGLGWIFYLISFLIIHAISDRLSRTKVGFHPIADKIGAVLFAWALVGPVEIFCWPILMLVFWTAAAG